MPKHRRYEVSKCEMRNTIPTIPHVSATAAESPL